MDQQLSSGYCDLVMGGIPVTPARAARILFSASYLDETLALVVRDHDREPFSTWSAIRARAGTTIAVPPLRYYLDEVRQRLPHADLRMTADISGLMAQADPPVDAIVMTAERGSAWTLLYPQFTVVVPEPGLVKVPLAYPISRHDEAFASFINTWIDLKRKDGTIDALYAYWVLGRDAAPPRPRWSIIRNVLHWVE
jgi:ABC-type amino acid transport substrate-binding protein